MEENKQPEATNQEENKLVTDDTSKKATTRKSAVRKPIAKIEASTEDEPVAVVIDLKLQENETLSNETVVDFTDLVKEESKKLDKKSRKKLKKMSDKIKQKERKAKAKEKEKKARKKKKEKAKKEKAKKKLKEKKAKKKAADKKKKSKSKKK